jgi:hypothetical protein
MSTCSGEPQCPLGQIRTAKNKHTAPALESNDGLRFENTAQVLDLNFKTWDTEFLKKTEACSLISLPTGAFES